MQRSLVIALKGGMMTDPPCPHELQTFTSEEPTVQTISWMTPGLHVPIFASLRLVKVRKKHAGYAHSERLSYIYRTV